MKKCCCYWGIVGAVIWYAFIYYFLYAIQNAVEPWLSALVLLVLGYLGCGACYMWVKDTPVWRKLTGKE